MVLGETAMPTETQGGYFRDGAGNGPLAWDLALMSVAENGLDGR